MDKKKMKSFRISAAAQEELDDLKREFPSKSETELIEEAISMLHCIETSSGATIMLMSGRRAEVKISRPRFSS